MLFVETDLRKRMPIPLWPFLVFGAAVGSASRLDAVVVYLDMSINDFISYFKIICINHS